MKAFKALILLGLAGMHKMKLRVYTFVFGGCVLKISLHYEHSLTALGNFRAGIEKSARHCVLRGCVLKIPLHRGHGLTTLRNFRAGIENLAGCSVLQGGVLKTDPHLRHRYLHKSPRRHSGMDCRNLRHRDVKNSIKSTSHLSKIGLYIWHCHPWLLDLGNPCRDNELCRYLCTLGKV